MARKVAFLFLAAALVFSGILPAAAQSGPDAWTAYPLNMRIGPGPDYTIVTALATGTALVFEARNGDMSWLLGRTEDGAFRGWVSSPYLTYQTGFAAARLPYSEEIVDPAAAPAPAPAEQQPAAPAENAPPPAEPGSLVGVTTYDMNVRGGPGTNFEIVGRIPAGVNVIPEGRNGDVSWILAHSHDGSIRGWLSSQYLRFSGGSTNSLPVSDERVSRTQAAAPVAPASENTTETGTDVNELDYQDLPKHIPPYNEARVRQINLAAYPIIPGSMGQANALFQRGKAKGRSPNVVAKVGDCFSEHENFLYTFDWGRYNLGDYSNLQEVINHFSGSMSYHSYAASAGFLAGAVLDKMWADPSACQAGVESPLECEIRVHNASVAVIMFGTQDLLLMTPEQFHVYLHEVVWQTMQAGVIPVLSTFPANLGLWDQTILYNQIVVDVATYNSVPLMNLWLALEPLPNHGLDDTNSHLSFPVTGPGDFTEPNLSTGYTMRNLVTLQTLDVVWRRAMR